MNGNAALDLVLQRIGRWGEAALRATALTEMQQVQVEYEQGPNLPWFLFDVKTASLAAGASDVAFPAGFIRFDDDDGFAYFDLGDTRHLLEIVLLAHLRLQPPTPPSIPRALASGDKLYLFPGTSDPLVLNIYAAYSDSLPVDAASTNKWLTNAAYVLVAKTAFRMAQTHLQDFELASSIAQQVQEAEQRLSTFTIARRYARVDLVKGE